jgi:hypothetical protein
MNFLLGLVLGALIAVGAAYVHDTSLPPAEREARAIVNWDAFDADMKSLREDMADGWSRLTGRKRVREERTEREEIGV